MERMVLRVLGGVGLSVTFQNNWFVGLVYGLGGLLPPRSQVRGAAQAGSGCPFFVRIYGVAGMYAVFPCLKSETWGTQRG